MIVHSIYNYIYIYKIYIFYIYIYIMYIAFVIVSGTIIMYCQSIICYKL